MTEPDRTTLREQIIAHEGIRLRPYRCTAGRLTIGVGRNLEDVGISLAEAMAMLDHDLDACVASVTLAFPWFEALDPIRQRALIDLRFNMGLSRLRSFKKALGAMARHDWTTAADELLDSAWARQVQPARRDRIVRMIRTGQDG